MKKYSGLRSLHRIERDYERFLLQERGLIQLTADLYLAAVRRFLYHRFGNGKIRLKRIRPRDVTAFVLHDSSGRGRSSLQTGAGALRSFFGFLFQRGRITTNLGMAIPPIARWRSSELPRYLEGAQVAKLLRSCDRQRKVGKRDYAILRSEERR